jgi:Lrp/AsnC family leucine-responsive transcriptional regulator
LIKVIFIDLKNNGNGIFHKFYGYLRYCYYKIRFTPIQKSFTIFFFITMINSELDPTDVEILKLLQYDAGLTNKELSYKLHKSIATIHERVRRLKEHGYIKRIVAILDRKKINKNLIAFSQVLLNDHTAETLNTFEKEVIKLPEVMECFQMTGTFDFILRVATSDMDEYHTFYRKLGTLPKITSVQSFFVLSETKSDTAYPL